MHMYLMEYSTQEKVSVVKNHGTIWHKRIWACMPNGQPSGKQNDKP